jgi:flagellar protein FliL
MADNEDQVQEQTSTEEEQDEPKKGKLGGLPLKIIAIVLLGSISLAGGLVAAVGLGGVGDLLSGSAEESIHKEEPKEEEEHAASYGIMNLEEFIVNITGRTLKGRVTSRFMKVKLSIVYDEAHGKKLKDRKLFVRDTFQDYMRQLDEKDLEGSYGLLSLKSELLKRAKAIAGTKGPQEILIGDLVIQ